MVAAIVSAVVGALVGAALSPFTNNAMAQVFKLLDKDHELWEGFKKDMRSLRYDLRMLVAAEEDQLSGKSYPKSVTISMEDMQELSYDIQDCMDRIRCYSESGRNVGDRNFANEVASLKQRLKDALERAKSINIDDNQCLMPKKMRCRSERIPVGIDEPVRELCNVLNGHPEQLSVISIVGFSGSGKTTLARAVYDSYADADKFELRAWVLASEYEEDDARLLIELQKELSMAEDTYGEDAQLNITIFLENKRYLIVLDAIELRQWDYIKSIFPIEKRSRIIVTTTNQDVAKSCIKHCENGYVYDMRPLCKEDSKKLLEGILKGTLPGINENSDLIMEKFDGHPLSLVSLSKYLQTKDEFPEDFWNFLGDCMRDEYAFSELQRVLIHYFSSLHGHRANLKVLLLYICVFPNTHPIRRSRLIRRWLAEGYVQDPDPCIALQVADKNLNELIKLNVVRPIDPSKKANPKTCRAHSIMHEFLLHIARSINFITDLGNRQRSNYRHLFLEGRASIRRAPNVSGTSSHETEEPRAHSLTVCGSTGEAVEYFPKCELLRVLDLEECNELEEEHTVSINKLWHLKYLSLGSKIKKVPTDIDKLHCLETLDMRKTNEEIELPVEVIKLPHLAHLLGKFMLGKERKWENNMKELLPRKSNMQVLTGFLTDDNPGFPMLMVHMEQLNKVKIWCDSVGNKNSLCFINLMTAIKLFAQRHLDTCLGGDRLGNHSLSLDLGNSSEDILTSLHNEIKLSIDHSPANSPEIPVPGAYLSSLKLHGDLCRLTQIATLVGGLRELCLSSTNGMALDELSNLGKLIALVYLKLVGVSLGGFVIESRDFPKLRRLCLVQCEGLPEIKIGALTDLLSLRILNKDLDSLSGIEIKNHKLLLEIGLDSEVKKKTKTDFEDAAKEHPKRPRVVFFKSVDTVGTASRVKYVAAERIPDTVSSDIREEQHIARVHSMVEEEAKPAVHVNRDGISSNYQNPNDGSGGELRYGESSHGSGSMADDHGKIKQPNHDTDDEDDGKGKNDRSFADEKAEGQVVINEEAVDGSNSAKKCIVITAEDNSDGKENSEVDYALLGKKNEEFALESQLDNHCKGCAADGIDCSESCTLGKVTDDRLESQDDDHVMVKAN